MQFKFLAATVAGAVLMLSFPASAHHSFGMFDMGKSGSVQGTIKTFEWTNPHAWIWVSVPTSRGGADQYAFECASLTMLRRQGWNKDTVKPGDKVSVNFHPFRDVDKKGGMMQQVKFADGHTLGGGGPGGAAGTGAAAAPASGA